MQLQQRDDRGYVITQADVLLNADRRLQTVDYQPPPAASYSSEVKTTIAASPILRV